MVTVDKYFKAFKIESIKNINSRELKRRFRILSLIAHPDTGGTSAKFRFVNDAYKYLLVLRKQYVKKESKKFFNDHFLFYGDGSIYDTKIGRWVKFKGKKINIKI
jgi:curved DNA-binding protein CbpA